MCRYFYYPFIIFTVFLNSCKKSEQFTTIESNLQQKAENILRKNVEKLCIDSALVVVMSVKTGEVKALIKLTKTDSLNYSSKLTEESINRPQEPGSIFIPFSIMASMEKGKIKMEDSVDTGNGIFNLAGRTFLDRNANHGGFGKISIKQSIILTSNIGTIVTVGKAFKFSDKFIYQLRKMSVIDSNFNLKMHKDYTPDLVASVSIGYDFRITPLQILNYYNSIANHGKMMKPVFYTGQDSVINPGICSESTIHSMQQTLCEKGNLMLHEIGQKNNNKIAGIRGTSVHIINSKIYDFKYCCSYFPSDNPRFSCLVILYRERNYYEDIKIQQILAMIMSQLAYTLN